MPSIGWAELTIILILWGPWLVGGIWLAHDVALRRRSRLSWMAIYLPGFLLGLYSFAYGSLIIGIWLWRRSKPEEPDALEDDAAYDEGDEYEEDDAFEEEAVESAEARQLEEGDADASERATPDSAPDDSSRR